MKIRNSFLERESTVIVVPPSLDRLPLITEHIELSLENQLTRADKVSVLIAVDEIYSNICKYSRATKAECICLVKDEAVILQFLDNGKPYDPLKKADPDMSADLAKRSIGGLGVYLVKQQMDETSYEYRDGKNCLTLVKRIRKRGRKMDFDKMKDGFGEIGETISKAADGVKDSMDNMDSAAERMKGVQQITPVGAKNGTEFSDLDKEFIVDKRIIGLCVRSGYIVDGIQVLYEDNLKGDMHGSKTGGGGKNIFFDEGDEVCLIEACYGVPFDGSEGAVSSLLIHTKNGKTYGPFGSGKRSSQIHLEVPSKCRLIGLCGLAGKGGNGGYVSALGLICSER